MDAPCTDAAFADDMAVISLHQSTLQELLVQAVAQSRKWRYNFNPSKTKIIKFPAFVNSTRSNDSRAEITMCGEIIRSSAGCIDLGIPISPAISFTVDYIEERLAKAGTKYRAPFGLGTSFKGLQPLVASKLYLSVVLPSMLYGLELIYICPSDSWIELKKLMEDGEINVDA